MLKAINGNTGRFGNMRIWMALLICMFVSATARATHASELDVLEAQINTQRQAMPFNSEKYGVVLSRMPTQIGTPNYSGVFTRFSDSAKLTFWRENLDNKMRLFVKVEPVSASIFFCPGGDQFSIFQNGIDYVSEFRVTRGNNSSVCETLSVSGIYLVDQWAIFANFDEASDFTISYSDTGSSFSGSLTVAASGSSPSASVTATVVEFYNTNLDNYFITANAGEATAIDNGSAGPGWSRTGNTFKSGGSISVCRFYGSQSPGPNSHFYTADSGECAYLKQLQASTPATQKRWNYESLDFLTTVPTNAACPTGTTPVYRAYNNGSTRVVDSNHRITTSLTAIQQVVARGWNNEGVVMCAPSSEGGTTPTYTWSTGSWGSCTGSCGTNNGMQYRTVTCVYSNTTTVADSFCSGAKPSTSQACTASACNTTPSITVSTICTSSNLTLAHYNAIVPGMTLDQVNQTIGCAYYPSETMRFTDFVIYHWLVLSGGISFIEVYFDPSGTIVTPQGNVWKGGSGF